MIGNYLVVLLGDEMVVQKVLLQVAMLGYQMAEEMVFWKVVVMVDLMDVVQEKEMAAKVVVMVFELVYSKAVKRVVVKVVWRVELMVVQTAVQRVDEIVGQSVDPLADLMFLKTADMMDSALVEMTVVETINLMVDSIV